MSYEMYLRNLKWQRKKQMKKTFSGLGFLVFFAQLAFQGAGFALIFLFTISGAAFTEFYKNNIMTASELLNSIVSLGILFLSGIVYCAASSTRLSDTLVFKKVKPKQFTAYVLFGLGIAYLGNFLSSYLSGILESIGITNAANPQVSYNTVTDIIVTLVATAIVPAFSEEFLFRGVLLGKLRKYGNGFAIFVSALFFGLFHGNIGQIPFAFVGGLVMGFMTVKTNSMLPAMATHFLNNLLSVFMDLLNTQTYMTQGQILVTFYALSAVIFLLSILAVLYLIFKDKSLFKLSNVEDMFKDFSFKEKCKTCFSSTGFVFAFIGLGLETVSHLRFGG